MQPDKDTIYINATGSITKEQTCNKIRKLRKEKFSKQDIYIMMDLLNVKEKLSHS